MLWWVFAFLSIVGVRWQRTIAYGESFTEIVEAMWIDLPYLLALLVLGFLIALPPLWLIGWLVSIAEPGEGTD
jgi:hypothetical protein